MIAHMPQILTIFTRFSNFIEQMLIHLLYALMTVSRDFKCMCMCVHTQVRVCVCTCNCHQLNGVWGVGPPKSSHIILEVPHPPLNVDTPQWDLH